MADSPGSVDRLNAVGVLARREIEARMLAPVVEALGREFDRDRVVAIVRDVIGGPGPVTTRCGWTCASKPTSGCRSTSHGAVMPRGTGRFGIPELGTVLSCHRDAALVEGFNPEVASTRTRTIIQGAPCCDFRYVQRSGQRGATGATGTVPVTIVKWGQSL